MLASLIDAPLQDPQFVYEPKYDGIRAIVEIANGRARLWSRLGNDKTRQFPEIAGALEHWGASRKDGLVLDGEIVALDARGEPAGFQQLCPRPRRRRMASHSSHLIYCARERRICATGR